MLTGSKMFKTYTLRCIELLKHVAQIQKDMYTH